MHYIGNGTGEHLKLLYVPFTGRSGWTNDYGFYCLYIDFIFIDHHPPAELYKYLVMEHARTKHNTHFYFWFGFAFLNATFSLLYCKAVHKHNGKPDRIIPLDAGGKLINYRKWRF